MSMLNLFFGFKGRIKRSQYWAAAGVQFVVLILLVVGIISSLGMSGEELKAQRAAMNPDVLAKVGMVGLALLLGLVVFVWSTAALYTKRLHDRNKGAIWLLAIYGPSFGAIVFPPLVVLSFISTLWVFIELGCLPGTQGPNRFNNVDTNAYLDDAFGKAPAKNGKATAPAQQGYGGMEKAMAAVTAAARVNPAPVAPQSREAGAMGGGPQFGQRAPAQFGRLNNGQAPGGFGRKV